jgi:hypothetical protein
MRRADHTRSQPIIFDRMIVIARGAGAESCQLNVVTAFA